MTGFGYAHQLLSSFTIAPTGDLGYEAELGEADPFTIRSSCGGRCPLRRLRGNADDDHNCPRLHTGTFLSDNQLLHHIMSYAKSKLTPMNQAENPQAAADATSMARFHAMTEIVVLYLDAPQLPPSFVRVRIDNML